MISILHFLPNVLDENSLERIYEFRARTLYQDGVREKFHPVRGVRLDQDHHDEYAHHFVAIHQGKIVGYLRLNRSSVSSPIRDLAGVKYLNACAELKLQPDEIYEASRWLVDPLSNSRFLAAKIVAKAWAFIQTQNGVMIGAAGQRQGQSRFLSKVAGFRFLIADAVKLDSFNDQVDIVFLTSTSVSAYFSKIAKEQGSSSFTDFGASLDVNLDDSANR